MSYKRSRSTFEADSSAPYAVFGTPLPDEADARDDGSYVPLWKQEVRDERGRKRLHGAFTGGWSAGYFNTVGSKEGWTPSTFVSSRTNRRKDAAATTQQTAEDFMDEEDLADAAEAQKIQTSQAFAGLGASTQDELKAGGLMGLFRAAGDTMGLKLLRKMGWKDGQGIGPKIRRKARLDMRAGDAHDGGDTHLFAPDNVPMIQFDRKTNRKGLGHQGEARLTSLRRSDVDNDDDEDDLPIGLKGRPSVLSTGRSKPGNGKTGMGVGILNDNGSDEDDPYEMGPKIRYNRVIGGDKKKKTKKAAVTNPLLKNAPTFVPKTARAKKSLRRCHDGRLPLDGFVLAREIEDLTAALAKYAPPSVPPGWKSAKTSTGQANNANYISTADAAKASSLDPRSRAALLGEKSLPGKSVFDFISSTARDKLAAASGRSDLPPARGEIGDEHAVSEEERRQALLSRVPSLDRETALAAISRSAGGPYADNAVKKARYRAYLERQANTTRPMPSKPTGMSDGEFLGEMTEFYNCARIFKPMTGFMASRFTTAKTTSTASNSTTPSADLVSKPEPKITDPAEEAAKMGMFGQMTRSTEDFYPTRLLCKRFNVMAPAHSRPDNEANNEPRRGPGWPSMSFPDLGAPSRPSAGHMEEGGQNRSQGTSESPVVGAIEAAKPEVEVEVEVEVNPDKNDAVEGKAAHEDVLRAIFGDSDSE